MNWLYLIDLLPYVPRGSWGYAVTLSVTIVAWLGLMVLVFPSVTRKPQE